ALNDVLGAAPYHWRMTRADEQVLGIGLLNSLMRHIDASQRFVADVSGSNQNVLLELGMMLLKNKQATLILADRETAEMLPIDLGGEPCVVYDAPLRRDREALREWLRQEVRKHVFFSALAGKPDHAVPSDRPAFR